MEHGEALDFRSATLPRCVAYVDANNLMSAIGRSGGSGWLDIRKFVNSMVPSMRVEKICYFTAQLTPHRYENDGEAYRRNAQSVYLKGLAAHDPKIEFIFGHYHYQSVPGATSPHGSEMSKVHRFVEKGTDVNLAVKMVEDAFTGDHEAALLISNDSDLAAALQVTRRRGIITVLAPPVYKNSSPNAVLYKQSGLLTAHADRVIALDYQRALRCKLPFEIRDGQGDLVCTRHDAFPPTEYIPPSLGAVQPAEPSVTERAGSFS